ncbi:DNA sulfur modification protein DndB [Dyadobacter fermentans]|uniref:DGQHR domain protein n=1 Tax=Dyadobacter fermentans (strain ATCC 700827 / DSM 18053 / CIP 107007 / KCTC 52180 / NS114) TaxID=471854 RepID=C6W3B8_DYAFD|nr:DNA sulfur modification protein DndB [Dyadobacter fermentans]ACT92222.1 DGQHR domain protein [Dyadobacter fermentans DSM 18053]
MSEITTLDSALDSSGNVGKPIKTFVGYNTGFRTLTLNMSLYEVNEMTEVANEQSLNTIEVAQRKLDISHASSIAKYILKGLLAAISNSPRLNGSSSFARISKAMGEQPYIAIPPLVASLRNTGFGGSNLQVLPLKTIGSEEVACFKIFLSQSDTLWIVDGQHRRKAIELVSDFIRHVLTYHKYPARGPILLYDGGKEQIGGDELFVWQVCLEKMKECTVAIEVHLGLDVEKERQLFHDLNNLGKRVDRGMALQYDGSNPVNTYIKDHLFATIFPESGIQEITERQRKDGIESGFTHQEVVSINALLFLNKTSIQSATPSQVDAKIELANRFWKTVAEIPGISSVDARRDTVAAQPVVLKALAKLTYDFHSEKKRTWNIPEYQKQLWEAIASFDFSHENPAWRYYQLESDEIEEMGLTSLESYLPSIEDGNRDLGQFSNGMFHFGAKHNDIYPIIGDIVRWYAKLPSRK